MCKIFKLKPDMRTELQVHPLHKLLPASNKVEMRQNKNDVHRCRKNHLDKLEGLEVHKVLVRGFTDIEHFNASFGVAPSIV